MSRENPKEKYVALVGKGAHYQILKEDAGKCFYGTARSIQFTLPDSNADAAVVGFSVSVANLGDSCSVLRGGSTDQIRYRGVLGTSLSISSVGYELEFHCDAQGSWVVAMRPTHLHASTHGSGGDDEVTIASIGAAAASDNVKFTAEGGLAILLVNKTGANSVKGSVLEPYSATAVDNAVKLAAAGGNHPVGIMYDNGVADGSSVWVVVAGRAQVLLEDSVAGVRDYWLGTSNSTAGRAQCTTNPTSQTEHMQELGHCLEAKSAGTDVLVYAILHFN